MKPSLQSGTLVRSRTSIPDGATSAAIHGVVFQVMRLKSLAVTVKLGHRSWRRPSPKASPKSPSRFPASPRHKLGGVAGVLATRVLAGRLHGLTKKQSPAQRPSLVRQTSLAQLGGTMRVTQLAARQRSIGMHLQRTATTYSLPVGFHEGKRTQEASERDEASRASLAGLTLQKHREQRLAKAFKHNLNASSFSDPTVLYELLHAGSDGKATKSPRERNIRLVRLSWMLEQAATLRAAQAARSPAGSSGAGVGLSSPSPASSSRDHEEASGAAPRWAPRPRLALRRRQQLEEEEAQQMQLAGQGRARSGEARIFLDLEELKRLDLSQPMPTAQAGVVRVHVACWSYCWETPQHSDPEGRTLLAFAAEVERLRRVYPTFPEEMGVFVDFCSIHQHHFETAALSPSDAQSDPTKRQLLSYHPGKESSSWRMRTGAWASGPRRWSSWREEWGQEWEEEEEEEEEEEAPPSQRPLPPIVPLEMGRGLLKRGCHAVPRWVSRRRRSQRWSRAWVAIGSH